MKKSIVTSNGSVEEVEDEEIIVEQLYNYDQLVTEYVREKYSIDDEIAITNNRMAVFDANLLPSNKEEEYNREYYEYQMFREDCKKRARLICNIS